MEEIRVHASGALIFDLDGVIADSGEAHFIAWRELCAKLGVELTRDDFDSRIFGRRNMDIFPDLLDPMPPAAELERLGDEKEVLFRAGIPDHVRPVAGVVEFIRDAMAQGVAVAIGSSAPRANVEATLGHFAILDCISAAVCGEDVTRGKPHPEVFVKAAQRLGRDINRSIVFEDAPSGIKAGVAAGARVVGLETTNPGARLRDAGAERVIQDFTGYRVRP